jgi:hypothetical protein
MHGEDDEDEIILALRDRSRRMMQTTFGVLGSLAIGIALAVRHYAPDLGIENLEPEAVANCFLCMGICYTATLFVWEWLFDDETT